MRFRERHGRRPVSAHAPHMEQLEDRRLLSSVTGSGSFGEDPQPGDGGGAVQVGTAAGLESTPPETLSTGAAESTGSSGDTTQITEQPQGQASELPPAASSISTSEQESVPGLVPTRSVVTTNQAATSSAMLQPSPVPSSVPLSTSSTSPGVAAGSGAGTVDDQNPVDDGLGGTTSGLAGGGEPGVVGGSADEGYMHVMGSGDRGGASSPDNVASPGITSDARSNGAFRSTPAGCGSTIQVGNLPPGRTGMELQSRAAKATEDLSDSVANENSGMEPMSVLAKNRPADRAATADSQDSALALEIGGGEVPTSADGLNLEFSPPDDTAPAPTHADLMTDFLPIDRATLEKAIDHILENFEGLGVGLTDLKFLEGLVLPVAGSAAVVLGAGAVIKWRKRVAESEESAPDRNPIFHPLLGLPA